MKKFVMTAATLALLGLAVVIGTGVLTKLTARSKSALKV